MTTMVQEAGQPRQECILIMQKNTGWLSKICTGWQTEAHHTGQKRTALQQNEPSEEFGKGRLQCWSSQALTRCGGQRPLTHFAFSEWCRTCYIQTTKQPMRGDGDTLLTVPEYCFGAEVHSRPSPKSDISMMHAMGSETVCGFFAGYHQHEGGQWSGDVYVCVVKSLEGEN